MKKIVLLFFCLLIIFEGNLFAFEDIYTFEDGNTLKRGQAAVYIYGGYPQSGAAYVAAPWNYINFGFNLEAQYDPAVELGVPVKVQFLESASKRLNFALTLYPAINFNFKDQDNIGVQFLINPGFAAGVRIIKYMGWFISGEYQLLLPISHKSSFAHFPSLYSGFEFPVNTLLNVILKGSVDFEDYKTESFIYGGTLGLGFKLW